KAMFCRATWAYQFDPPRRYPYLTTEQGGAWGGGNGISYDPFENAVLATVGELRPRDVLPPDAAQDEREARIATLTEHLIALGHRMGPTGGELDEEDDAEVRGQIKESLRRLSGEKKATARELETLKLESSTGKAEALAEAQTLVRLLAEVKGTPQEE